MFWSLFITEQHCSPKADIPGTRFPDSRLFISNSAGSEFPEFNEAIRNITPAVLTTLAGGLAPDTTPLVLYADYGSVALPSIYVLTPP